MNTLYFRMFIVNHTTNSILIPKLHKVKKTYRVFIKYCTFYVDCEIYFRLPSVHWPYLAFFSAILHKIIRSSFFMQFFFTDRSRRVQKNVTILRKEHNIRCTPILHWGCENNHFWVRLKSLGSKLFHVVTYLLFVALVIYRHTFRYHQHVLFITFICIKKHALFHLISSLSFIPFYI